ncbi:hypothetical protein OUZ56_012852 [Daphnia magna]|uniref:Uncharacterized protein n=1 Tax=Daphnia magna TaxID=35525 RepID=A0ABQ9Z481_9CRUS|nr:hypothetical protein OUZ56_012852 [Daphnia magna]
MVVGIPGLPIKSAQPTTLANRLPGSLMGDFFGDEPRVNRVFQNRGRALAPSIGNTGKPGVQCLCLLRTKPVCAPSARLMFHLDLAKKLYIWAIGCEVIQLELSIRRKPFDVFEVPMSCTAHTDNWIFKASFRKNVKYALNNASLPSLTELEKVGQVLKAPEATILFVRLRQTRATVKALTQRIVKLEGRLTMHEATNVYWFDQ